MPAAPPPIARRVVRSLMKSLIVFAMLATASSPSLAATSGHKKVYLLRGLTNVLSPGIDQLNEELLQRNVDVTIANHLFSDWLAREAIAGCQSGQFSSVVMVGHSLGASAAISMADQMREAGLHVALIVTMDPVVKTVAPDNVGQLKNFYLSSGVGTTVERGDNFHGTLENVDMGRTEYGHVSLTTAPAVQTQVLHDVLAANSSCR